MSYLSDEILKINLCVTFEDGGVINNLLHFPKNTQEDLAVLKLCDEKFDTLKSYEFIINYDGYDSDRFKYWTDNFAKYLKLFKSEDVILFLNKISILTLNRLKNIFLNIPFQIPDSSGYGHIYNTTNFTYISYVINKILWNNKKLGFILDVTNKDYIELSSEEYRKFEYDIILHYIVNKIDPNYTEDKQIPELDFEDFDYLEYLFYKKGIYIEYQNVKYIYQYLKNRYNNMSFNGKWFEFRLHNDKYYIELIFEKIKNVIIENSINFKGSLSVKDLSNFIINQNYYFKNVDWHLKLSQSLLKQYIDRIYTEQKIQLQNKTNEIEGKKETKNYLCDRINLLIDSYLNNKFVEKLNIVELQYYKHILSFLVDTKDVLISKSNFDINLFATLSTIINSFCVEKDHLNEFYKVLEKYRFMTSDDVEYRLKKWIIKTKDYYNVDLDEISQWNYLIKYNNYLIYNYPENANKPCIRKVEKTDISDCINNIIMIINDIITEIENSLK